MDATRILSLRDQVERAAVSTAVILLTFSNISGFVIPAHAQTLKVIIKKHIDILLEDFKEDPDLLRYLLCHDYLFHEITFYLLEFSLSNIFF